MKDVFPKPAEVREAKERFTITLPVSLKAEIEAVVPERQRSRFAVQAFRKALKDHAIKRAIDLTHNLPSYPTHGEDSVEILRGIRDGFSDRYKSKK